MAITVGMVSLGCSKNRVDSEQILGMLRENGFEITNDEAQAEVIIVNTCGFINPAKEESIGAILEMAQHKKNGSCRLLVATGCLSQRYPKELREELPEVDIFWGVKDKDGLVRKITEVVGGSYKCCSEDARIITTPSYSAYLRIADGCDNRCTYCAIPLIRGGKVSIPMEKLVKEAQSLADSGVKELTLIAQDTSAYGTDLYGKPMLAELMRRIVKIDKLHWIRVLYSYPNTIDEELVDTMVADPKIVNYIDIPIQHIDPDMLKAMNRHGSAEHIREITDYIRRTAPDFILRTTVITGFPGETEGEFAQTLSFLQTCAFAQMHIFPYSRRQGTPAAGMPGQIPNGEKARRAHQGAELARAMEKSWLSSWMGQRVSVLFEEEKDGFWRGYTPQYIEVRGKGENLHNRVCPVTLTAVGEGVAFGVVTEEEAP